MQKCKKLCNVYDTTLQAKYMYFDITSSKVLCNFSDANISDKMVCNFTDINTSNKVLWYLSNMNEYFDQSDLMRLSDMNTPK